MESTPELLLRRWVDRTSTRWFYFAAAVAILLVATASFGPELLDQSHNLAPYTWLIIAHSVASTAWLIVLIIQTLLIQSGSFALHRRVGTVSMGLAALMVVLGYATAIAMMHRGFDISGSLGGRIDRAQQIDGLIFPLLDIVEFAVLVTMGYLWRHKAAAHKRLMLFATVALLPAPFAHFIGHSVVLREHPAIVVLPIAVSLIASGVYDLARFRRIHPISLWLGIGLFVIDNFCATVVGPSAAWHAFAGWLIA